ncbi:MAG: hypothetical protein EPO61_13605 [Nitrospirae bacterium]|nr:MAG: hypothetical protein EPO61_13605 [Nitrospirota bacterium]
MEQINSRLTRKVLWSLAFVLLAMDGAIASGCARQAPVQTAAVLEGGRDVVRTERSPAGASLNSHPINLTPHEISALLRGVRVWERRNIIHELLMGKADKKRAFREDEISVLSPALSRGLAQAARTDRVYFHLSNPTETGDEETTTGWVYVQEPLLYLVLTEVHDKHGPQPDISKYDRQLPNISEVPGPFNVTFEPEEYLERVGSASPWFSPEQQEQLEIRFRKALSIAEPVPGEEPKPGSLKP